MKNFKKIILTIWLISPACDPGWRYRATVISTPKLAEYFEITVAAHYFGSSTVQIQLKNVSTKDLIIAPLYSYATSLACPNQIHVPYRVKITKAAKVEIYDLELPEKQLEAGKGNFDMRELWGKPGSSLKKTVDFETADYQGLAENVSVAEINRTYLMSPAESINLVHYIPTFSCKHSGLGYPNSAGQAFELTIPISENTEPLVLTIDKAAYPNR
jgi:hypothetical protein